MKIQCASMVIPVFNEQATLPALIERCVRVGQGLPNEYELILVDDGSRDGSARLIAAAAERDPSHVVGVLLNRNYGQHAAVMAGLGQARGDVVVTLDADLQNPPEEIPKLLAEIERGADVVGGIRQMRKDSLFRVLASALMNRAMRAVTGLGVTDYGCMLRAYRRDIVDAMLACSERAPYIPALANSFAANTVEVEVGHAERSQGESKYRVWSLVNLYFDLLVSSTTAPLRMLSIAGTALAGVGVAFGLFLLVLRFVYGPDWAAQGVFTLLAVLFVFLGVQLIGLGLLGEYLGRVSRDLQGRPRYIVREIVGAGQAAPPRSPGASWPAAREAQL